MKKFLVVLAALLFATGAFAEDAAKTGPQFKYEFFGIAYGISGAQKDYSYDYSHVRVRPFFTVGNENVKGVVRLEIDQDFGKQAGGVAAETGADPGTDNKVIEVKWAYLEVADMLVPGLTFKAGLAGYYFPLVTDNDFALYQGAFDFGVGKAILSYIKRDEFNQETVTVNSTTEVETKDRDDVNIYAVDLPIKAGVVSIRPGFMYFTGGKESTTDSYTLNGTAIAGLLQELSAYNAAVNFNADFGVVVLDATAAYLSGETKPAGVKQDFSSYAGDVIVTIKPSDMFKAGLFFTLYSGDDAATSEYEGYQAIMDIFTGYAGDGRLFLLDNAGVAANGGNQTIWDKGKGDLGLYIYGLNAEAKLGKLTLFAQAAYVTTAEDNTAGDSYIGTEIDARVSYEVAPKTLLFGEAGYIVAGDDMMFGKYDKAENAYEVAWGVKTSI